MIDLEEESFEASLTKVIEKVGFENAIIHTLYPFLRKIGVLWQTGNINPAQEHFITQLIRQKMIVAIDQLPVASKKVKRALLFLPENELHEIGLLFYHYISKKAGLRTYYLGQTVPYTDLKSICTIHKPSIIITAITTSPQAEYVQQFIETICKDQPMCQIMVTGAMLAKVKVQKPENLHLFKDASELRHLIKTV
jgi:methanogenic corrinoid protein MtbC1